MSSDARWSVSDGKIHSCLMLYFLACSYIFESFYHGNMNATKLIVSFFLFLFFLVKYFILPVLNQCCAKCSRQLLNWDALQGILIKLACIILGGHRGGPRRQVPPSVSRTAQCFFEHFIDQDNFKSDILENTLDILDTHVIYFINIY